jgi:hypothetical protein
MNKKWVIIGVLLLIGVTLSGCVGYGGGYGYGYDYGYGRGYSFSYNYGYPYGHGYYYYGYPHRYPDRYPPYPHGGDHHHESGDRSRY